MKRIIFSLSFLLLTTLFIYSADLETPKKVKIISQSCTMASVFVSVVDLSNNEVVILEYVTKNGNFGRLINVIRTGMTVDPKKITFLEGKDVPFQPKSN